MTAKNEQTPGTLRYFWHDIGVPWIDSVSDELAECEFECRKPECSRGEWETCAHRLEVVRQLQSRNDSAI
jgi:hypothetical protein